MPKVKIYRTKSQNEEVEKLRPRRKFCKGETMMPGGIYRVHHMTVHYESDEQLPWSHPSMQVMSWCWIHQTALWIWAGHIHCLYFPTTSPDIVISHSHERLALHKARTDRQQNCYIWHWIITYGTYSNGLTRITRRTRYLALCQYCLVVTYELTCTSQPCGQRLPSVYMNFNAAF